MNEKNQQESFRRWGYGLAAAAGWVLCLLREICCSEPTIKP